MAKDDPNDADAAAVTSPEEKFKRAIYRTRAGDHRAPTDYIHFKLRIRSSLVRKLQKEADKKKHSANHEAVQRLEESFSGDAMARRDTATLNLMLAMVAENAGMGNVFAAIILELGKKPDLSTADAAEIGKRFRDVLESYQKERE